MLVRIFTRDHQDVLLALCAYTGHESIRNDHLNSAGTTTAVRYRGTPWVVKCGS
jgi:hypothetical protein